MTELTPAQKAAATRKARRLAQTSLNLPAGEVRAHWTGLCIRVGNDYRPATRDEILDAAATYIVDENRGNSLNSPRDSIGFFRSLCAGRAYETFAAAFLDTQCRIIKVEALFKGTIDSANVYPREVVRRSLELDAAAVIFAHNHPSGIAQPSEADRAITVKLRRALELVEIRMLDHVIVTATSYFSLAERGWI
jgi:DNA repair protein RadC